MRLGSYSSYEKYKEIQSQFSVRKRKYIWAQSDVLDEVVKQVRNLNILSPFGICHGVRNGFEVAYFEEHMKDIGAKIIGTEISEVSEENPSTIQWDFHDVKPEWIGKVNFIYSNSFDHSYNPHACLAAWMSCISPNGICVIEWTNSDNAEGLGTADCFRADLDEYKNLANMFHVDDVVVHGQRNAINSTQATHLVIISHPKDGVS